MPPPPAEALTSNGKPTSSAASSSPSSSPGANRPEPGSTGTPAAFASSRARSLSPMSSMHLAVGPTQTRPASSTARAKPAFSARNP